MSSSSRNLTPIPAFSDNYIWMLDDNTHAIIVDPGDADSAIQALAMQNLTLSAIIVTHHHFDHVGGIDKLKQQFACPVYGPHNPAIPSIDTRLAGGDNITLLEQNFEVIAVPGHTLDHIAYYNAEQQLLFCGDTLFAAGCGRLFEGDAATMVTSLNKLSALPAETRVACTHEYTESNLKFALSAEPSNTALQQRQQQVAELRSHGQPSLPSTIAIEIETNPFLRCDSAPLIKQLEQRCGRPLNAYNDVFAELRAWKDNF